MSPMGSEILCQYDVRNVAIAPLASAKTALDYHEIEINVAGSLNQEPLVDVGDYGIASDSAYARAIAPYYRAFPSALSRVLVRRTVVERLAHVNEILVPYRAEVLALDGFRPIELQGDLWQHFIAKGREVLVDPSEADLVAFAGTFCSDPRKFNKDDYRTWPVHNTGGAIDLTLRSLDGNHQELFMGSIFDDADAVSDTRHFENPAQNSQSSLEARRNRRLLYHAMAMVGFANYSHEWWHFDFGTQMWVMNGCHHGGRALYGRTEPRAARART